MPDPAEVYQDEVILDQIARIVLALQRVNPALHEDFLAVLADRKRIAEERDEARAVLRVYLAERNEAREALRLIATETVGKVGEASLSSPGAIIARRALGSEGSGTGTRVPEEGGPSRT